MKKKCMICGMIRSRKDMVLREDGTYICFSCWNKLIKTGRSKNNGLN